MTGCLGHSPTDTRGEERGATSTFVCCDPPMVLDGKAPTSLCRTMNLDSLHSSFLMFLQYILRQHTASVNSAVVRQA